MADDVFILGVNGSPYRDGIVAELLRSVLDATEARGAETRTGSAGTWPNSSCG